MTPKPLDGLRVISFEQFGAGPYATMFIAALGGEVLKVEALAQGGDHARRTGPTTLGEDDSLYYQTFNLNKKSICLDLKDAEDRERFHQLAARSHAVLNNMRGSLPAKLGLDYAALSAVNPALVCGHISAYGRDNSRESWPGYDFLMQAETGFMAVTGEPGGPPTRVGLSMVDYMTGMMMAFALVSAVRAAEKTGLGADVDISLFDAATHQLAYQGTWFLNEGIVTDRQPRSSHPTAVPCQLFKTADGWVYIGCMHETFWRKLAVALGREDLLADPRFADGTVRLANRETLTDILDQEFIAATAKEWAERLQGVIPVSPVYDLKEALTNEFLLGEAGMVADVEHPLAGALRMIANPIRIDGRRPDVTAAPGLGADADAIAAILDEPPLSAPPPASGGARRRALSTA
ncbi:MAG: CoA transferase [Caulobacterales bacterium]|nr:CoA transferase [Caulobacterales bacterium]